MKSFRKGKQDFQDFLPLSPHSFPLELTQEAFQTQLKDRQAIKVRIKP
jgi:hypothetical protein